MTSLVVELDFGVLGYQECTVAGWIDGNKIAGLMVFWGETDITEALTESKRMDLGARLIGFDGYKKHMKDEAI
jgi:hypothetical protein